jgi:hypothetical protein
MNPVKLARKKFASNMPIAATRTEVRGSVIAKRETPSRPKSKPLFLFDITSAAKVHT